MPFRTGEGVMVVMAGKIAARGRTPVNRCQTPCAPGLPGHYRAIAVVGWAVPMRPLTRASPVLFLCLFTSQAALLVLSPVLPAVAHDLGVSTATAGQLRSLSGLTGGITAVLLAMAPRRPGLRDLLSGGVTLVAAGSALS